MMRIEEANRLPLASYRDLFLPSSLDPLPVSVKPQLAHSIRFESCSTMSPDDLNACFNLIASSSANAYATSSIGWSPVKKRKEMKLPDLRYLLLESRATDRSDKRIEGFLSFMLTYEDGYEVVYCYEIHLAPHLQGQGIGRHLMMLVEGVGTKAGVAKSMLTVFVENQAAMRFYEKLGYSEDEYSPEPRKLRNGTIKMPTYSILSKSLKDNGKGN
ncbi:MAG: hypothetical protein LQ350_006347 [Teloschistes chrysophthalmus]|nr:MAG: hypothetical protein LQ350_006347 [Niorma chrysophthalma]